MTAGAQERGASGASELEALLPLVRRVVRARVSDASTAEDLVQETLARVLASRAQIGPGMLEPYAVSTARNLVAQLRREQDRHRRHQHRLVDLSPTAEPGEDLLAREEQGAMARALARLGEPDRRALLAHEVDGEGTRSLAAGSGSTPGAVAAQLHRARARLRAEYLLALDGGEAPSDRCRPVLFALSGGDRRRQQEVGAARHLLECSTCARVAAALLAHRAPPEDEVRVPISGDPDIVAARSAARELAQRLGLSGADLTVLATAVSEIARNIVRFTSGGEVVVELLRRPRPGVRVVARDTGPGIPDLDQALTDGFTTCGGLGLGLPGARRLVDEFEVVSEVGRGTTVTMTKWQETS